MNLSTRSYRHELLDNDNIPFEDIKRNMQELNFINTWLGGHAITLKGVKRLIGDARSVTIGEIGCGGGDNLLVINKWCSRKNIKAGFIGVDIKPECIRFAQSRKALQQSTTWIASDYREVKFAQKPDVLFSSLFCHHFTEEQLVEQLAWMRDNSTIGFFINDLERNSLAYYSIKILTRLFSKSYLVKNDAPLSVARGFTINEWEQLFHEAGINNWSARWQWAFRHLLIHKHG